MGADKEKRDKLSKTVRELGASIREDAQDRWNGVKMAHRRQRSRMVWRFQTPDAVERFLHVPAAAITQGRNPAAKVMGQLREAGWLDRFQKGPETSFVLAPSGQLQPWPKE